MADPSSQPLLPTTQPSPDGKQGPAKKSPFTNPEKVVIAVLILFFASMIFSFIVIVTKNNGIAPPAPNYVKIVLDNLLPQRANQTIYDLSRVSHIAGSPETYAAAEYIRDKFIQFGLPLVWNESYPVMLHYPISRSLSLLQPTQFTCTLEEAIVNDGTSGNKPAIPTFNGWSADGDETAPLIYVNYDYKYITEQLSVNLTGKIVIVRYGQIFRGDKCHLAETYGAVGCIIYSDPADDGYDMGPVYMEGPWRAPTSVQRGSVWIGNGDPTTPGYPSTPNSPRLTLDEARDAKLTMGWPLPTIPVQPISYQDAEPLLRSLTGTVAPHDWQGGIRNLTYHIGLGAQSGVVRLALTSNFTQADIFNVFAKIPGEIEPDRYIIIGAHRDAWVFGAGDPLSGTAEVLTLAGGFGAAYQAGWRPRRTLIFVSWDAEEYGLVGSVEFCELHEKNLIEKAVAYLNFDVGVTGNQIFEPAATPQFKSLLVWAASQVKVPNNETATVLDMWRANWPSHKSGEPILDSLGSGSDYAGFIQHLGVSAVHFQMGNSSLSYMGVYHSNYDSYYWMSTFGDPTWEYHVTQAKVAALTAQKLVDDVFLPYNYTEYAIALKSGVEALAAEIRAKADPTQPANIGTYLQTLNDSVVRFRSVAELFDAAVAATDTDSSDVGIRGLNDQMMLAERAFLDYKGLPGRSWLRHVIWAPSEFNAYEGVMFPTVADALFLRDWMQVEKQLGYVSLFINSAADALKASGEANVI